MARSPLESFEVPPEMRALTEKSVEQARHAFEGFMAAAQRTVSSIEGQAASAQRTAKDVGQQAMTFAERNIASSFDLAQRLVRAKTIEELLQVQADYIRGQMRFLAEQARSLGEDTADAVKGPNRRRN